MTTTLDTQALLNSIDTDNVKDNFVETDRAERVYAKVPQKYEPLPDFPDIQGLQRWTQEEAEDHFVPQNLSICHMDGELMECYGRRVCDECDNEVGEDFYHCSHWSDPDSDAYVYDYDLCLECAEKKPELVKKYNMTQSDNKNNGMGSIFSWIPIYRDEEFNSIFYCAVKDEPKYGKLAMMSVDNHGRLGMYTLVEDIETLKPELEELYQCWTKDYPAEECSWDKAYNVPIKLAMDQRGFEVHYG